MKKQLIFCIFLSSTLFLLSAQADDTQDRLASFLDGNSDGLLDPFEALDVLLQVQQELDGQEMSASNINHLMTDLEKEGLKEAEGFLREMDVNKDGRTALKELDPEMLDFARILDHNKDGYITAEEATSADIEDEIFLSEKEIRQEVKAIFREFDENGDGSISRNETEDQFQWDEITSDDQNGDGKVTRKEMLASMLNNNTPVSFRISDGKAYMSGVINVQTPARVLKLIFEHPEVRTIVMTNVPGSVDDESNLRAATYVREAGFTTILHNDSSVASGGTDFFLAGASRIVHEGAKLGIHSWGGPGFQGKDVPKDDPQHQPYLEYYEKMGIPGAFYWRTLEAAPANDIHWMTEDEIKQFNFRTTEK